MVEEVLELCGGMEEEGEGFRSRARIIFAGSVVDSFVYGASGRSVVGEDVSLGDERPLVQPQSKSPHLKRITIHYWVRMEPLWSQSHVCMLNWLRVGVVPSTSIESRASHFRRAELHLQLPRSMHCNPKPHSNRC